MTVRKVVAGSVLAAGLSAAAMGLASPAGAACASIGKGLTIGDTKQCSATFGNIAIVPDKGSAHVLGGIGNSAIAWGVNTAAIVGIPNADNTLNLFNSAIALGDNTSALSAAGFVNTSLAAGRNTNAFSAGFGSTAVDAGDNTDKSSGSARAVGLANRAINLGGDNTAVVTSAFPPVLDLEHPETLSIGNNSVINIGKGNFGAVQGGFSNGVYQIGDRNIGAAGGVLSNLIQIGNDNYGTETFKNPAWKPYSEQPKYITVPKPNTAFGLGAENLVVGNGNEANAQGNLVQVNTFGNGNKNNLAGGPTENPDLPLPALHPNLSMSNVFGNGNKVDVKGNADLTNVVGNDNKVGVEGNRNITSVFGNGNKVAPKYGYGPGVKGNNNITTIVGNLSKAGSKGNGNLTSVLGHRSIARSFGDNKVSAAIGDDKKNVNGTDVS